MTHETFRELVPLYVIGALDGAELRDIEQYIAAHPDRCAVELAEYEAATNQLALATTPVAPPSEVFDRITAEIEPPVQEQVRQFEGDEYVSWGTLFLRRLPWLITIGMTAMVLLALWQANEQARLREQEQNQQLFLRGENAYLKSQLSDLTAKVEDQTRTLQTQMDQLRAVNNDLTRERDEWRKKVERQDLKVASLQRDFERQSSTLDLMMDPALHVGQMTDPGGKTTATAKVYWHDAKQTGLVIVSNLPAIPQGGAKSLELWVICADQPPIPAGLFWTDKIGHGVAEIKLAKQVACAPKFAVSIEAAAGAQTPSDQIILLGQ